MRTPGWYTSPLTYDTVRSLSRQLGTSEIMASVLARRGFTDADAAREFLSSQGKLHDPFLFPHMEQACARIRRAIESGERICVHGDYDVDGITATSLLLDVIGEMGGDVSYYLPNRFNDGYGITADTVSRLAEDDIGLLITVDCGIVAGRELAMAAEAGMDTIVVDHHRPVEGAVPEGTIISPLLCDYPFKDLAGVGLAFKLAQALLHEGPGVDVDEPLHPSLQRQLDRVALGTIADVVPLLGENRALVKRGLTQLARTRNPGLSALMKISRLDPASIRAGQVAFRLAPRINAAGRLGEADRALALLLADSESEAAGLAAELDGLNQERQRIENQILAEAQAMMNGSTQVSDGQPGIVLSSPAWHEGVIGIVASRMVDIHHRPVIMIAEGETQGKGSGRSIPRFDLHEALVELEDMLVVFGGHSAACGLTIDLERIEDFRRGFTEVARSRLDEDALVPSRKVDALASGRELTLDLAEELSLLEPFGAGNPSVDLMAAGAQLQGCRKTRDGNHLQCRVESGGSVSSAIGFGQAYMHENIASASSWDVVFRLERNEFNGSVSPQLNLRALIPREEASLSLESLCRVRCTLDCTNRLTGEELWTLLKRGAPVPDEWLDAADVAHPTADRIIDHRGYGAIPQQIARLAAGGESILLIVADVARRQRLMTHEIPLTESMISGACFLGSRCSRKVNAERLSHIQTSEGGTILAMLDAITLHENTSIASHFDHLVFVDPPFNKLSFNTIAATAPEAWLHLIYCNDELQFTKKVLEHEYCLQGPLKKIYRNLNTGEDHPLDETTEKLLLGGGKFVREPRLVARSLAVLRELGLADIEDTPNGPILTLPASGKTELKDSATYSRTGEFHQVCQRYLNSLKNQKTT